MIYALRQLTGIAKFRPCLGAVLLAAAMATLLAATEARAEGLRLVDDSDQVVTLPAPAARIVSLAPHITESLFAVGAGAAVVGTVSYSDYPAAAASIPIVGSYDRISAEQVLALAPDLVIAWHNGNSPATIEYLRSLGLRVYVTNPLQLAAIPATLRDFSRLTGSAGESGKAGQTAADRFQRGLDSLAATFEDRAPVTVFYQVWDDPLLTINDHNMIADVIRLCGGVNIFRDAMPLHPVVSIEAVLRRDPQVIIASGMGEERPEWLNTWRDWPATAARNDHLHFIPPSLLQRHSIRILEGARQMCAHIDRVREASGQQVANTDTGSTP